ncbi:hypothetical protein NG2371_01183 [Nocardia gamkensis]|nr:hypothetical protein [Nocardia gamkensis]
MDCASTGWAKATVLSVGTIMSTSVVAASVATAPPTRDRICIETNLLAGQSVCINTVVFSDEVRSVASPHARVPEFTYPPVTR